MHPARKLSLKTLYTFGQALLKFWLKKLFCTVAPNLPIVSHAYATSILCRCHCAFYGNWSRIVLNHCVVIASFNAFLLGLHKMKWNEWNEIKIMKYIECMKRLVKLLFFLGSCLSGAFLICIDFVMLGEELSESVSTAWFCQLPLELVALLLCYWCRLMSFPVCWTSHMSLWSCSFVNENRFKHGCKSVYLLVVDMWCCIVMGSV